MTNILNSRAQRLAAPFLLTLMMSVPLDVLGAAACSATSGRDVVPLVELFTSEGCDSCPPTDRWLSATFPASGGMATASVLAFHVDYWDRLGWKDRFASAAYTERQYAAMRANGATFVYTPQVLLQGREISSGQRARASELVSAARGRVARAALTLDAVPAADGKITAHVHATIADSAARKQAAVWVAYTDSALVSEVKAGENRGVRLTHDHVVRALFGPYPLDARGDASPSITITPPTERGQGAALVAFVQDTKTGDVLQTLTLPCGG